MIHKTKLLLIAFFQLKSLAVRPLCFVSLPTIENLAGAIVKSLETVDCNILMNSSTIV